MHSDAPSAANAEWRQIVSLYDQLMIAAPSPVVALNRAVAVSEVDGAIAGLAAVNPLATSLVGFHLFHATRGELLMRLGRAAEAVDAYDAALVRTVNAADRRFLAAARRTASERGGTRGFDEARGRRVGTPNESPRRLAGCVRRRIGGYRSAHR